MTQCDRVIRHIEMFGSITSAEAMNEYGIYRLASRINDLKKLGYAFQVDIINGINRFGEKTHLQSTAF